MELTSLKTFLIGFGSQAQAWAQNLRDSNHQLSIVLRSDSLSQHKVAKEGFEFLFHESLDFKGRPSLILLLTPDNTHLSVLKALKEKNLPPGSAIIYAHGQSLVTEKLDQVFPEYHHLLLAPKAIASEVRRAYLQKSPLGAVFDFKISQYHNNSLLEEPFEAFLIKFSKKLGINYGPYRSTFRDEMMADLYSEQTLLCSTIPYLMKTSFEKLVNKGLSRELAYMECVVEFKIIVDAFCELGPQEFFKLISPAALVGSQKAKDYLFDSIFDQKLEKLLKDIQTGVFTEECNKANIKELREKVVESWKQSKFEETHQNLSPAFFPKKDI